MNDVQIRSSFHKKKLQKHHAASDTIVIDELGLKHGKCRADIAVINGHLIGYEIKSDDDSLNRLAQQVGAYSAVFDRVTAIVGRRHLEGVKELLPHWWGIIIAIEGQRSAIRFETVRPATLNPTPDDFSVAQLLWRNEAEEELVRLGYTGGILRQKRSVLYGELVNTLSASELRKVVRERLKSRTDWRCPVRLSQGGDSSRPCAT